MKRKLLFCTLCLSSFVSFTQVPQYIPTNGLKAWYPFNSNSNDESGNGYHLSNTNCQIVDDRFSSPSSAYYFDDNTDNMVFTGTSGMAIDLSQDFSYSFWIYPETTGDAVSFLFVTTNYQFDCQGGTGMHAFKGMIDNNYEYKVGSACQFESGYQESGVSNHTLSLSNWHNVTIVKTISNIDIYVNGVLRNSVSCNDRLNDQLSSLQEINLSLGTHSPPSGAVTSVTSGFTGKLDDICIYNRALNSNEITSIYNGLSASIEPESIPSYSVYPNPTTDFLNISGDNVESVKIFDLNGRLILSDTFTSKVDVSNLSNGMYQLLINDNQRIKFNKTK
ncbi:MAG: LamG-like jellyroll fold domain-containing protein [Crocinitomicaceae bacterium]